MSQEQMLQGIYDGILEMKSDIKDLKTDVQNLKTDMQEVKTDVQNLKTDMQEVKVDVQMLKIEVQDLKTDVQMLKIEVQDLKTDVQNLKIESQEMKERLMRVQLTLENETRRNIMQIADGHLDLSRKLDEALKVENEKEMLIIRVNTLEKDVSILKKEAKKWHRAPQVIAD